MKEASNTQNSQSMENYRFYAFISYSRKNEAMAKWLQKKLESYRLPAVLQKQHSELPKKLKVFRDQTDIGVGGTVEHALSRELQDSKKLIVLCSPDSAKSDYVEYEVASFLKIGRSTDDILPIVVEGKIDADSPDHCYTPLLTSLNLNAADAVQEGKNNAFIRLLASLLAIKYDDLKRREKMRTIRRNALLSVAAILMLCFAGLFTWYVTPHTKYYADYVTRWGIPEGLGKPLTKKECENRFSYYEITYHYGRPIKLVCKDHYGKPCSEFSYYEHQNRPKKAEYSYEHGILPFMNMKDWYLKKVFCVIPPNVSDAEYDQSMQIVYTRIDNNPSMVMAHFYYDAEGNVPKSLSNDVLSYQNIYYNDFVKLLTRGQKDAPIPPDAQLLVNASSIYRHKIIYDENGMDVETRFYNLANQPARDDNGICGFRRNYDKQGFLQKEEYIYDNIEKNNIAKNVSYKRLIYNQNNTLCSIAFYYLPDRLRGIKQQDFNQQIEEKGTLINNKSRNYAYAEIEMYTTDNGKIINESFSFFDENKSPCYEKMLGAKTFNDKCVFIKDNAYYEEGNWVTKDGTYEYFIDSTREIHTYISYLDKSLYNKIVFQYNDDGDVVKKTWYDEKNNALERNIAYNRTIDGNLTIISTIPNTDNSAYSTTITQKIDKYGRYIEETYEWIGDNPLKRSVKIEYKGMDKRIMYYDNEKLSSNYIGFAGADFSYHSTGVLESVVYKDEYGRKVNRSVLGCAEYSAIVTSNGLLRHEEFKNAAGDFVVPGKYRAYAYYDADLNFYGTFLQQGKYYMPDGTMCPNKYAFENDSYPFDLETLQDDDTAIKYYDSNGDIRYWRIYDKDGKEKYRCEYTYKTNGAYEIEISDSQGRIVLNEYRDSLGKIKNKPENDYAVMKWVYYASGESKIEYFDENRCLDCEQYEDVGGNTIKYIKHYKNGDYGIIENTKNEKEITMYSKENVVLIKRTDIFNEDGSFIRNEENYKKETSAILYYDKNKKLILNEEGWSNVYRYKTKDGFYREKFYDENNELIPYKSHCVSFISEIKKNSVAERYGIRKGDILLEGYKYSYFDKHILDYFNKHSFDISGKKTRVVIYRPEERQIISFLYTGTAGFSYQSDYYPCDTIEECDAYISDMKTIYNEWLFNHKTFDLSGTLVDSAEMLYNEDGSVCRKETYTIPNGSESVMIYYNTEEKLVKIEHLLSEKISRVIEFFADGLYQYKCFYPEINEICTWGYSPRGKQLYTNFETKTDYGIEIYSSNYDENGEKLSTTKSQLDTQGNPIESMNYLYNEDGSFVETHTKFIEHGKTECVWHRKDENTLYIGEEGWAAKIEYFDDDGYFRIKYLDENENLLLYQSGAIKRVESVESETVAEEYGIQSGDILLVDGDYCYFDESIKSLSIPLQIACLQAKYSVGQKSAVFYRPAKKQIISFTYDASLDSLGYHEQVVFPADNPKDCEKYIARIKSAYEDWLKSQ